MSRFALTLLVLTALLIGVQGATPSASQAGPIHKHIEQKMLAKPAKKPKAPPPPKKKHKLLHHHG